MGRERRDWRMDRSRSGGETEERETCDGMDRGKVIKERDSQRSAASIFPVCTWVSFFNVCERDSTRRHVRSCH